MIRRWRCGSKTAVLKLRLDPATVLEFVDKPFINVVMCLLNDNCHFLGLTEEEDDAKDTADALECQESWQRIFEVDRVLHESRHNPKVAAYCGVFSGHDVKAWALYMRRRDVQKVAVYTKFGKRLRGK
ncbi:hypothetical protein WJX72_004604 [[Myrmecia] bisecta]|uniref:Uncharacterized protein n=1 Tax=[Myrmecia] bisecta TaxID=41462 RepID=A0AAW1QRI4_9CHLO